MPLHLPLPLPPPASTPDAPPTGANVAQKGRCEKGIEPQGRPRGNGKKEAASPAFFFIALHLLRLKAFPFRRLGDTLYFLPKIPTNTRLQQRLGNVEQFCSYV